MTWHFVCTSLNSSPPSLALSWAPPLTAPSQTAWAAHTAPHMAAFASLLRTTSTSLPHAPLSSRVATPCGCRLIQVRCPPGVTWGEPHLRVEAPLGWLFVALRALVVNSPLPPSASQCHPSGVRPVRVRARRRRGEVFGVTRAAGRGEPTVRALFGWWGHC